MTAHEYTEQSEKGDGGEVDSAVTEIVYANTDEGCDPATEENSFGRTADRAGCGAAEKAGGEEPVGTARIETPGFIPAPELIGTVNTAEIHLEDKGKTDLGNETAVQLGSELKTTTASYLDISADITVHLGRGLGLAGNGGIPYRRSVKQSFTVERRWEVA